MITRQRLSRGYERPADAEAVAAASAIGRTLSMNGKGLGENHFSSRNGSFLGDSRRTISMTAARHNSSRTPSMTRTRSIVRSESIQGPMRPSARNSMRTSSFVSHDGEIYEDAQSAFNEFGGPQAKGVIHRSPSMQQRPKTVRKYVPSYKGLIAVEVPVEEAAPRPQQRTRTITRPSSSRNGSLTRSSTQGNISLSKNQSRTSSITNGRSTRTISFGGSRTASFTGDRPSQLTGKSGMHSQPKRYSSLTNASLANVPRREHFMSTTLEEEEEEVKPLVIKKDEKPRRQIRIVRREMPSNSGSVKTIKTIKTIRRVPAAVPTAASSSMKKSSSAGASAVVKHPTAKVRASATVKPAVKPVQVPTKVSNPAEEVSSAREKSKNYTPTPVNVPELEHDSSSLRAAEEEEYATPPLTTGQSPSLSPPEALVSPNFESVEVAEPQELLREEELEEELQNELEEPQTNTALEDGQIEGEDSQLDEVKEDQEQEFDQTADQTWDNELEQEIKQSLENEPLHHSLAQQSPQEDTIEEEPEKEEQEERNEYQGKEEERSEDEQVVKPEGSAFHEQSEALRLKSQEPSEALYLESHEPSEALYLEPQAPSEQEDSENLLSKDEDSQSLHLDHGDTQPVVSQEQKELQTLPSEQESQSCSLDQKKIQVLPAEQTDAPVLSQEHFSEDQLDDILKAPVPAIQVDDQSSELQSSARGSPIREAPQARLRNYLLDADSYIEKSGSESASIGDQNLTDGLAPLKMISRDSQETDTSGANISNNTAQEDRLAREVRRKLDDMGQHSSNSNSDENSDDLFVDSRENILDEIDSHGKEQTYYNPYLSNQSGVYPSRGLVKQSSPIKSALKKTTTSASNTSSIYSDASPANQAYLSLTTAENTRLNAQLTSNESIPRKASYKHLNRSRSMLNSNKGNHSISPPPREAAMPKRHSHHVGIRSPGAQQQPNKRLPPTRVKPPKGMTNRMSRNEPAKAAAKPQVHNPHLYPREPPPRRSSFEKIRNKDNSVGMAKMSMRNGGSVEDNYQQSTLDSHFRAAANQVVAPPPPPPSNSVTENVTNGTGISGGFKSRFQDSDSEEEGAPFSSSGSKSTQPSSASTVESANSGNGFSLFKHKEEMDGFGKKWGKLSMRSASAGDFGNQQSYSSAKRFGSAAYEGSGYDSKMKSLREEIPREEDLDDANVKKNAFGKKLKKLFGRYK
ncbi:YKL105C and SEG1 (YMR086W) [Zygosaccharomyces parabailii]|nr:YKL105C and SEG1 (YMR086W) [Zygosaccharomyces parabailii]CDH10261.1 uncharacterized protein ZBAI_02046 [Zygosaccharomyces bailii ISA1307]